MGAGFSATRTPFSISRLRPYPAVFSIRNPASVKARRIRPTEVKVARVVPGLLCARILLMMFSNHISGLRDGANPSRNQASA